MSSLRQQCKQRLKVAFDSIRAISGSLTFILVVDDAALKVISSTIKMMQLVNYGINSIQRLQLKRKKFKKIQAVYLIHPDSYSTLLQDYQAQPQYGSIHILTLTKIPPHIMNQLSLNETLVKRIKTLKQLNFNFVLYSDNQFLVQKSGHNYSNDIVFGDNAQLQIAIKTTVDQLATVVTSMSQFYIVEILYSYFQKSQGSKGELNNSPRMAEKIAIQLKDKLQKMFQLYSKYNVQNYTNGAPQTTFLILDRWYDGVTPLMRDFHYMPLLYDMKDCYKHKIQGQGKDKKIYTMDDNQPIFDKFKNQHISKAISGISEDFQEFSREHIGAKMQKNKQDNIGLDKMTEVMKKIPQYNQLKDKYSFHMTMANKIMNNYQKNKYRLSGELEQTLACRVNQNGKPVKQADILGEILKTVDQLPNEQEKARLILIALLTLQWKPKQFEALTDQLKNCKQYADVYKNIQKVSCGMHYTLGPRKVGKQQIILDRNQPKIQQTVKKITQGGQADLKYLRIGTQVRGKSTAQKSNTGSLGRKKIGATTQKVSKPRLIVFFCTAISYNEIRALSAFEKDYHIIYGSHSFTTQTQYFNFVNNLGAVKF